jgi:hypothetical protein
MLVKVNASIETRSAIMDVAQMFPGPHRRCGGRVFNFGSHRGSGQNGGHHQMLTSFGIREIAARV